MSLNFNFTDKVRFNQLTDEDKKLNDVFIWGCMAVCLREISEKNAAEWQWRYAFAVNLNGAFFYNKEEPYIPTLEEVKKRIGLSTNADNKTRKQFIAGQVRINSRQHAAV